MFDRQKPSRRRLLQSAGAVAALAALPAPIARAADAGVTARLARYMVAARDSALPEAVALECKHRILDTFGAMISGSRMNPGIMAVKYVRDLGGTALRRDEDRVGVETLGARDHAAEIARTHVEERLVVLCAGGLGEPTRILRRPRLRPGVRRPVLAAPASSRKTRLLRATGGPSSGGS